MSLRLDWCSYEAARYAILKWHYSHVVPTGKNNYIGVWENGQFIGVVVFGTGASAGLGMPYGLTTFECCELVRVALTSHQSPVSRIVAIALRMVKQKNVGLRLCVSFADPAQKHIGIIYQAGNWIYSGDSGTGEVWRLRNGALVHPRRYSGTGWNAPKAVPIGATKIKTPGKYRYLYPFDTAMREQIKPLAKPYPKRATSIDSDAAGHQPAEGGAHPTVALQQERAVPCNGTAQVED